ncbi:MAG: GNAT family N-acetyltransferase [Alphaproteobacteria bacterium]|nr:GNAT family N-acetyltransferase [Alphaproteobacteria bacterium]
MSDDALRIRTMSRSELDVAVDWAAREGWNPGLDDADAFHAADPGGFLVACRGVVPAASISVVRYGDTFGFLGFYIATPDERGRGTGLRIWQAGMARLAGRVVGLDGVIAQQDNYRKSGFVLAQRNIRYGGKAAAPDAAAARGLAIVDARDLPFDRLLAYDRRFFPAERAAFLSLWLGAGRRIACAATRDGEIAGLGVIRSCRRGFKLGPLYADRAAVAEALVAALHARAGVGEQEVFLDVPEPNRDAVDLATRLGLAPAFETARMYAGPAPDVDVAGLYGVTTFELG